MEFMKKVTIIFLLFFIFIFGVNAFAQEGQDSYDMSFEQAYELMFVNNNSLKAAMKAKDVARHQKMPLWAYIHLKSALIQQLQCSTTILQCTLIWHLWRLLPKQ